MRTPPIIVPLLALILSGCDVLGPSACTASIEPALVIEVYDAVTGEPAGTGASGWVRDGAYVDSVVPYIWSADQAYVLVFRAADERPGRYDIFIEKAGYEDWQRQDVSVRDGACHVRTVEIRADLVAAE